MAGLTRELRAERDAQTQVDDGSIQCVMMVRDKATYPAPHAAQVNADEVQNDYSGGWVGGKS